MKKAQREPAPEAQPQPIDRIPSSGRIRRVRGLGPNGPDRITLNSYDAANELTQVTTGYLTTNQVNYATMTYTANGFAKTVLDGANNLTTVVYDNYDRPYQVQFPMPTAGSDASNTSDYEQYGYDNDSNLTTKRLRSGDTVTFAYDALNRPTSETFPAGKSQNVYWGYDLLNRQLYANYGSPTGAGVSWTYDALGRVVTATNSGKTLSYQYDAASNRTRMTWPDTGANALYVQYVYDVLNRVTQIEENGATSGPGLLAAYSYDSLGRRSSVARAGGSGAATGYTYDGASRLHTLAQTLAGSASVTYTLGYNAANQIVTKQVSNSAYVANPAPITAGYTANALNQYTGVTGITASYVAANSATLTYDATGALQTETTAGATATFLYDGVNLVGEYSSSGAILNRYVPGPGVDEPVLWYQGSGTSTRSWLTADNQSSVIGYADQSGNSGATYTYGPYGEPITSNGASAWGGSRYRFTGQIEIPEVQIYYYKARVYDPAMGRFYQTDPAGYASNVNSYAYVGNDPINGYDPSGLGFWDDIADSLPDIPDLMQIPDFMLDPGPEVDGLTVVAPPPPPPPPTVTIYIQPDPSFSPSSGSGNVMLISNSTSQPQNKGCLANVGSFVNAHLQDAQTLATELGNGVTPAEVLATAGNETHYGGGFASIGNYFGLHGHGPAGTYYTPSNHTAVMEFSGGDTFLASGQVFVNTVGPYMQPGMGTNPLAFFSILNQHGYATGNSDYPAFMVAGGGNRGPYTLVNACLGGH